MLAVRAVINLIVLASAVPLFAAPVNIISVGPSEGGRSLGPLAITPVDRLGFQIAAVSWSSANSYSHVNIFATLDGGGFTRGSVGYIAYLTNQIGQGTTLANQIASTTVSLGENGGHPQSTLLFSNLTLGPGTFYLVVEEDHSNPVEGGGWYFVNPPKIETATGVILNGSFVAFGTFPDPNVTYAPSSTFGHPLTAQMQFSVISDSAVVLAPSRQALAQTCLGRNPPGPTFCNIGGQELVSASGPVSVSGIYGSAAIQARLSAAATAVASFGSLGATSSASFDISGTPGHAFGHGIANFVDVVTVDFAPLTGQTGFMPLSYTLTGSASSSSAANALAHVDVRVGPSLQQDWQADYTGVVAGAFTHVFTFIYGQPFGLRFSLSADSGTVLPGGLVCIACSGIGTGSSNFFNTLTLSGLVLQDQFGNPVAGATFTSVSGTPYSSNGVGLPVTIDIKPGDHPPSINPASQGTIPVAILSSPTLDATSVDRASLTFGRFGVEHSLAFCDPAGEDVNRDGFPDLVCHFSTQFTGFQAGDSQGVLRGKTLAGVPIVGTDRINVVR